MYTFVHRPGAVSRPLFSKKHMGPPTRGLFEKFSKTLTVPTHTPDPKSLQEPKPSHIALTAPIHPNPPYLHQIITLDPHKPPVL